MRKLSVYIGHGHMDHRLMICKGTSVYFRDAERRGFEVTDWPFEQRNEMVTHTFLRSFEHFFASVIEYLLAHAKPVRPGDEYPTISYSNFIATQAYLDQENPQ